MMTNTKGQNIGQRTFELIRERKLSALVGKDGLKVVESIIKREFPGTKFDKTHYAWYLSKFRKQAKAGAKLDRPHVARARKEAPKAKGKAKKAAPKAKKAEAAVAA